MELVSPAMVHGVTAAYGFTPAEGAGVGGVVTAAHARACQALACASRFYTQSRDESGVPWCCGSTETPPGGTETPGNRLMPSAFPHPHHQHPVSHPTARQAPAGCGPQVSGRAFSEGTESCPEPPRLFLVSPLLTPAAQRGVTLSCGSRAPDGRRETLVLGTFLAPALVALLLAGR